MLRFLSISTLLILPAFILNAQEVVFSTQVPVNKMGLQDVIHVQYEILNTQRVGNIKLSKSDDFKVLGDASMSRNINMMNDKVSMSVTYTYSFQPKRLGRLKFPVAIASANGRRIKSNQASIDVVKGSLADQQQRNDPFAEDPFFEEMMRMQKQMIEQQRQMFQRRGTPNPNAPNPQSNYGSRPDMADAVTRNNIDDNLFIRAEVDKKKAHVGEQVTVTYKLYARVKANMGISKLPALNNFWAQDFDIPRIPEPRREILNGKEFNVFLLKKTALFPNKKGKLVIDPIEGKGVATLRKPIRVKSRSPYGNILDDEEYISYTMERIEHEVKSNAVTIDVVAFPEEEKPAAFRGAVGSFEVESKISAAEITTDDIATLTLTIRGNGNIKLMEPPEFLIPDSIVEMYDLVDFDTITSKAKNKITGFKKIRYRFSPKGTGLLKVPPIVLAYYNADAERYEVKQTPEYSIRVKPGKQPKSGTHILPMYIHDIAGENTMLRKGQSSILPEQLWYWGAYLLPTFGFLLFLGFKRKEQYEQKDTIRFKNKRANKVALKRLDQAEQHRKANESTKFYEETSKAVWLYLSDKLNIPLATLSKEMAGTLLRKREIKQELIDEVFLITDECELALYAPDSGDFKMNQIYSDSLRIIGSLEDKLA